MKALIKHFYAHHENYLGRHSLEICLDVQYLQSIIMATCGAINMDSSFQSSHILFKLLKHLTQI